MASSNIVNTIRSIDGVINDVGELKIRSNSGILLSLAYYNPPTYANDSVRIDITWHSINTHSNPLSLNNDVEQPVKIGKLYSYINNKTLVLGGGGGNEVHSSGRIFEFTRDGARPNNISEMQNKNMGAQEALQASMETVTLKLDITTETDEKLQEYQKQKNKDSREDAGIAAMETELFRDQKDA